MPEIDSSNRFLVRTTVDGSRIAFNLFTAGMNVGTALNADEALNLAAWLSVMADPGGERFAALVKAIKGK